MPQNNGYTIFHSNGSTKEVAPEHTPIIDKLAADNSDESINNFYNPNHIPSNTVKITKDNITKDYDVRSKEYKDLYDSGHLASYDAKTNTYYATPLKEVVITAEAPQWLKDKRKAEQIYKQNEINYQSRNPVENTNINKEITSSYLKDRQTKQPEEIHWYNAINYKKWGLKDYSSYSSFNSAFRNSKESGEKEFVYKDNRYSTKLIDKEQSDLYNESKQFLQNYYKNNNYKPIDRGYNYSADKYLLEKKGDNWSTYYDKMNKEVPFESVDWATGKNVKKREEMQNNLDNFTKLEEEINNGKNTDFIKWQEQKNKEVEINNLNSKDYYWSITDSKPKTMEEDGYLDAKNKKIFLTTNAEPTKLNTTYIHELSHKGDDYDVYKRVPEIDVDKINKNNNPANLKQKDFEYIKNPTEVEARKFSTLFYLYKTKQPYINISKQQLDNLYKNQNELPYDIKQLLSVYLLQQDDLLKYLNNDFNYTK